MPTLALTRRLPAAVEAEAARHFTLRANPDDRPWTPADFAATDADALLCTVTDRLDAATIAALPTTVRLLANFGVGTSHIDLAAATTRGIAISNTPDVLTDATADLAILLMLGAARRAAEGEAMMRARAWTGWAPTAMLGTHLGGKTLGILGMGRIGAATATRAAAFGMTILYHGRREQPGLPWEFVADAADFWPRCQALSLHAPLTPATRAIINADTLSRLPAGAILVNTARGELVDDDAVIAALRSGQLAAAGLDVFTNEPAFDPRYASLRNSFLLPHLGSATTETRTAMGLRALANARAFFAGDPLPDPVSQPPGSASRSPLRRW
ncbi:2-hydroxyacid dehydrogenase [Sandaracinobacteroides saxicola]|uniref:D-glycerate dehydrogenase n=1 Tax=Sandaracinobacteroides saxicola TaxID=2759707 RepID=A0A7G5II72_9SPHN|nr:D-glycerate dehydrogenase [Sandaracinobacteroides saxicola]QMW23064.1 D-glycerate dehydrogenase [Sandaracinobacteroides saxicola]